MRDDASQTSTSHLLIRGLTGSASTVRVRVQRYLGLQQAFRTPPLHQVQPQRTTTVEGQEFITTTTHIMSGQFITTTGIMSGQFITTTHLMSGQFITTTRIMSGQFITTTRSMSGPRSVLFNYSLSQSIFFLAHEHAWCWHRRYLLTTREIFNQGDCSDAL